MVRRPVEGQTIQRVQKTVEASKVQFIDKVVDVPVVRQRQVPTRQRVQKTVEVPQVSNSSTKARCDSRQAEASSGQFKRCRRRWRFPTDSSH